MIYYCNERHEKKWGDTRGASTKWSALEVVTRIFQVDTDTLVGVEYPNEQNYLTIILVIVSFLPTTVTRPYASDGSVPWCHWISPTSENNQSHPLWIVKRSISILLGQLHKQAELPDLQLLLSLSATYPHRRFLMITSTTTTYDPR